MNPTRGTSTASKAGFECASGLRRPGGSTRFSRRSQLELLLPGDRFYPVEQGSGPAPAVETRNRLLSGKRHGPMGGGARSTVSQPRRCFPHHVVRPPISSRSARVAGGRRTQPGAHRAGLYRWNWTARPRGPAHPPGPDNSLYRELGTPRQSHRGHDGGQAGTGNPRPRPRLQISAAGCTAG